jgi:hypothetical protein
MLPHACGRPQARGRLGGDGAAAHTLNMFRVFLGIALLITITSAFADQSNKRLDMLFEQLRATQDMELGARAV